MTIGQKIIRLRTQNGMSQERLAEMLGVSRQSISKWEMEQSLPQMDKVLQIADLFSVTTDALLRQENEPNAVAWQRKERGRYFGTDGFRGEANVTLTSMQAYRVGRFLGWYYASTLSGNQRRGYRPKIVIGKDTRRSCYMLEYSIVAGITASGADAYMLHVITTPGVSFVTRQEEFDCGIMITASHNPYYDNGIKIINRHGEKMDDAVTDLIEAYLDGDLSALGVKGEDLPLAQRDAVGCIHDYVSGRNRYIGYLISLASHSYKHLRIGLDCANGASWNIARAVFDALGAQVHVIGAEPDGLNVNRDCGSTHIERLQQLVKEKHLDVGFAFDGDADRCLAVDENGKELDGDAILYVLAKRLSERGMLNENTVVATVMSNRGFVASLAACGIHCVETTVGDRFVYEAMQAHGYSLGGEQSGHIILKKYATTGDGLLTAIMLTEELCDRKSSVSALVRDFFRYPQLVKSVAVRDKAAVLADESVRAVQRQIEAKIGQEGRVLLRASGTEGVVRVMVECATQALCEAYSAQLVDAIVKGGYCVG